MALSGHDVEVSPDVVTTLFISYEWRRFISEALQTYADSLIARLDDSLVDDFRNQFQDFLDDFYTPDAMDNTPVGTIVAFSSTTAPEKWLYCNGQIVERSDYPELWDITPALWHNVPPHSGTDKISLPDLRERFVYGATNSLVLGTGGGEATHTLTIAEMPAHTHGIPVGTNSGASLLRAAPSNNVGLNTFVSGSQGGGAAHNNLPPYMMFAWMIKALP